MFDVEIAGSTGQSSSFAGSTGLPPFFCGARIALVASQIAEIE